MNLIFDTHPLIWWLDDSPRLGRRARQLIARPNTTRYISVVSAWELGIKQGIRKFKRPELARELFALFEEGFHPLKVEFDHAYAVADLPLHHADPFDRLLVAQAQCEGMAILTADSSIEQYDVETFDATT